MTVGILVHFFKHEPQLLSLAKEGSVWEIVETSEKAFQAISQIKLLNITRSHFTARVSLNDVPLPRATWEIDANRAKSSPFSFFDEKFRSLFALISELVCFLLQLAFSSIC